MSTFLKIPVKHCAYNTNSPISARFVQYMALNSIIAGSLNMGEEDILLQLIVGTFFLNT